MTPKVLLIAKETATTYIKDILSKLNIYVEIAVDKKGIRAKIKNSDVVILDDDIFVGSISSLRPAIISSVKRAGKIFVVISSHKSLDNVLELKSFGASDYIVKPFNHREFIVRLNAAINKK